MNDGIASVFTLLLYVLILLVIARSLLSWFPVRPDNQIAKFLVQATEPLLAPVRNILPRTGMFDFSSMIVIFVLYMMLMVVQRAAES